MKIQKHCIKYILASILIVAMSFCAKASNSYNSFFKYDLTILNSESLSVKIYPENITTLENPIIFSFNQQIPNYYLDQNAMENIEDVRVFLNDGTNYSVEKSLHFSVPSNFERIEYIVKFKTLCKSSFIPVCNINKDYSLLNMSSFLGFFEGFFDYKVSISIFKENKNVFFEQNLFSTLLNKTVCINCERFSVLKKGIPFEFFLTENDIINKKDIILYFYESFDAIKSIENIDRSVTKDLIFIFDESSDNTGAIAHKNNLVFHFNKNNKYQIQKTIIHELLHLVLPEQDTWLNESLAEYLAVKLMLQADLISEKIFLKVMSKKLRIASKYPEVSLQNIQRNSSYYNVLYSKGAIDVWFLDLAILNASKFNVDIIDYILFNKSIPSTDKEKINTALDQFEEDYIINNKPLPINKYVNTVGIIFDQYKLNEIKEKQGLELELINGKIIIVDNPYMDNFIEGDEIISIDKFTTLNEIQKDLHSMSDNKSLFKIIRNGETLKIKIENKSILQKLRYHLSFFEKKSEIQKIYWNKFKAK